AKLVTLMARLLVTLERDVAELKSTVYECAVLPAANSLVEASVRAGKEYNNTSKDMKKAQNQGEAQDWKGRGSPHLHIFMTFMIAAVSLFTERKDEEMKTVVIKAMTDLRSVPLPELGLIVRVFRVRLHKIKDGEGRAGHFEWAMGGRSPAGLALHELMGRVMTSQSAERMSGPAPRGPLAREIIGLSSKS
ncbi:unnamed protein product, partial [Prorocentrum cordatum]